MDDERGDEENWVVMGKNKTILLLDLCGCKKMKINDVI